MVQPPNPQFSQYPQYPPPAAPKPKRRGRKILIAAIALIGVIIIGSALGSGGDKGTNAGGGIDTAATDTSGTPDTSDSTGRADQTTRSGTGIGTEARDGKFAFTVTTVDTGVDHVGGQFTRQNAQGQFVLVHVTVKNIGDEAQLFDASSQTLFDNQGRRYDADSGIAAIALDDANSLLKNINPGNAVDGILLYDVPKGVTLTRIELHDSPFSGGVTVTLSQ